MKKLLIIFLLMIAVPCFAGTYYVDATGGASSWANCEGSDPGNGSRCSISQANSGASAGDTVYFFDDGGAFTSTRLIPANSGTSSNWIIFKAYPGESPTISGQSADGVTIATSGDYSLLDYEDFKSYIEINGFTLSGNDIKGVRLEGTHHIRILNCIIANNKQAGVSATAGGDHILVEGNVIYGNCNLEAPCSSGISFHSFGCPTGESSGCKILDDEAAGYHNIIRYNIIYGNRNDDASCGAGDPPLDYSDGNGIIIDNCDEANPPTLIFNNLVYHNGGRCIQALGSPNTHIINNTCWENKQSTKMQYNGTGSLSVTSGPYTPDFTNDPVHIKNNLVYGRDDGCLYENGEASTVEDYNLFYVANTSWETAGGCSPGGYTAYDCDYGYIPPSAYRGCTTPSGAHDILRQDPLFLATSTCTGSDPYYGCDWESQDYKLENGSPAKNAGTDVSGYTVTDDFEGKPRPLGGVYDIGAYEMPGGGILMVEYRKFLSFIYGEME